MRDFEEQHFGRKMPDGTTYWGKGIYTDGDSLIAHANELPEPRVAPYDPTAVSECSIDSYFPLRAVHEQWGTTYPLPTTARRGGIKYPKPTQKENDMATAEQRKTRLKQQMTALQQQLADVQKSLAELDYPEEPPAGNYSIVVHFPVGAKDYEYLLKKLDNGVIFTTGTGDTGRFQNWKTFLNWLRDNVQSHSCLTQLSTGGRVWLQPNEALR